MDLSQNSNTPGEVSGLLVTQLLPEGLDTKNLDMDSLFGSS